MNLYKFVIGYDIGGPESGPIYRSNEGIIVAESRQDAEELINWEIDGDNCYDGHRLEDATPQDISDYVKRCIEDSDNIPFAYDDIGEDDYYQMLGKEKFSGNAHYLEVK